MSHTVCEKCKLWIFDNSKKHTCRKIHNCEKDGHDIEWFISFGTCRHCKQTFNNEINNDLELDQISNYY